MRDSQGQLISNMPNTRWVFVNFNGQTNVSFPGLDFNRRILQVLSMETGNRNSKAGIFQAYPLKSGFADTWKVQFTVTCFGEKFLSNSQSMAERPDNRPE